LSHTDNNDNVTQQHIMLVEDDLSLAKWIGDYLTAQGYLVTLATRGDEAVHLIKSDNPDMVILDITLPVMNGFDICKEVRNYYHRPILMMTARNEEDDEIMGLELGADDYVTKPVRPKALLARVNALLRRKKQDYQDGQAKTVISYGGFSIDSRSRSTSLNDQPVAISSNEFDVLWILASKAGETVSREALVKELRGIEYDGFDRSTDILISRLRKKLNDNTSSPYRIKTIWGKGYLFATDAWD